MRQPVLGFIGIHAGKRTDQPISQNETLALLFESVGYRVVRASAVRHPALRTLHQIVSLLRWRKVDAVVIAVFSGRSFWIADFASFLAKRVGHSKVILFMHGGNLGVFGPEHRAWVSRVYDRADLLLAPSDFLADAFRAWGYDVHVIPNVLSIQSYRYQPRTVARPNLLWMRTFHEHYDPLVAVEALARVAEVHPDATMTMGGADHGLLEATKARAAELGVADRIRFPGYLTPETKAQAFADHDVFLNTNIVDNMPVSVLEAAASGLVPVATAVGGIPALLTDGVDSRLVPAGDAEAIATAVLGLLEDPDAFAALSRGARELALRSGWPAVYARWREELHELLPHLAMA
ncbi:MAG: glycosyltransferase family 4 protein [Acidimicrobiales bacterium]